MRTHPRLLNTLQQWSDKADQVNRMFESNTRLRAFAIYPLTLGFWQSRNSSLHACIPGGITPRPIIIRAIAAQTEVLSCLGGSLRACQVLCRMNGCGKPCSPWSAVVCIISV